MENSNNNNNTTTTTTTTTTTSNKEIEIDEEDKYLGIYHLDKKQLIETIREIREEFFELQDDHDELEKKYKERVKEIEYDRKLLSERENLLLQLQWDPQEDKSFIIQMGASDINQANENRMKAMVDQMRVMEKGINDREDRIKQLQKTIEQFTLNQLSSGAQPTEIVYSQFNTIVPNNSMNSSINSSSNLSNSGNILKSSLSGGNSTPVLSKIQNYSAESPSPFSPISKYPLSKEATESIEQTVTLPSEQPQPQEPTAVNKAVDILRSTSTYFTNLFSSNSNEPNGAGNDEYADLDTKPFIVPLSPEEVKALKQNKVPLYTKDQIIEKQQQQQQQTSK
ncbi:hypothetical protein DICPUDRAFT_91644 [Dictyostelium purpureum]|uniref:Uncharacterized protein n=1 Tax=Dictyostelium purpureum TaxID=5786 RepID=F0ZF88_DICPU|nr:uncharacterized protein DICPUDRAFT_91644 [Dictyostelium purpureum]EGC37431.1 hypothetical protein DICPUDRAFT_91644 [Dictyostelium purpureum]|eukprot:XP_003286084.1 hypothetical protein DICPUDRAFT_91644 [Dictyostelium purpureum]